MRRWLRFALAVSMTVFAIVYIFTIQKSADTAAQMSLSSYEACRAEHINDHANVFVICSKESQDTKFVFLEGDVINALISASLVVIFVWVFSAVLYGLYRWVLAGK